VNAAGTALRVLVGRPRLPAGLDRRQFLAGVLDGVLGAGPLCLDALCLPVEPVRVLLDAGVGRQSDTAAVEFDRDGPLGAVDVRHRLRRRDPPLGAVRERLPDLPPRRPGLAGLPHRPEHLVDEVVVRVQQFGLLPLGLGPLLELLDRAALLLDDALLGLDPGLEVRPLAPLRRRLLLGVEPVEVVVERRVERVVRLRLEILPLDQRERRRVDDRAVLRVDAGIELAAAEIPGERLDLPVQRLVDPLAGVGDVERLLDAGPRAELFRVEPPEVQLGGERPNHVGVGLLHPADEAVVAHGQGVHAGGGELVGRAGDDGPGLQPDRLQAVDHPVALREHGDVPLAEQFGDDPGPPVAALEREGEDAVVLVLLDAGEVGPGDPVAEHHREVRRPPRRVGDALGRGGVGPLDVAHLHQQFDPPPVEVPELQPEQVVAVEVGLVDLRSLVPAQFGDEGGQIDAGQFPLALHTRRWSGVRKGVSLCISRPAVRRAGAPTRPYAGRGIRLV
jgi:hypothetical protein